MDEWLFEIPFSELLMNEDENAGQEKANAADHYVHNTNEWVFAAQPRSVRYNEAFGPFERHHRKLCPNQNHCLSE